MFPSGLGRFAGASRGGAAAKPGMSTGRWKIPASSSGTRIMFPVGADRLTTALSKRRPNQTRDGRRPLVIPSKPRKAATSPSTHAVASLLLAADTLRRISVR